MSIFTYQRGQVDALVAGRRTGLEGPDAHLAFAQVWTAESGGSLTDVAPRYWPGEIVATACVVSVEAVVASASGAVLGEQVHRVGRAYVGC
jgi:hypothetical protein